MRLCTQGGVCEESPRAWSVRRVSSGGRCDDVRI